MPTVKVAVQRLVADMDLPSAAYPGDAGIDLCAACDCWLKPGERKLIPTGLAVAIPEGYAGFVLPRSGLALRKGLSMANTPGLIDSHFRGELQVVAVNLDPKEVIEIQRKERIAQLVVLEVPRVVWQEALQLDCTERGDKGFGSSGS
ncbi:MAG: dUTP diphosphatase [Actinomycetia bacterium]|nr:dUTP diphosphatase [Actinomycetes bacterium]